MTNEEAIKKIKSLCHDCDEFPHCVNTDPDCFKALEMAIKALEQNPDLKEAYRKGYKDGQEALAFHLELCKEEQEPTVKENLVVGDCISRQAAIDAFERFIHELGIEDEPYNYGEMALSAKNVPSVTPQPKTDFEHKAEIVISQLRADRDRLQDALEKIKVEIKEWYWQADKQALAKDPCVVDAMIDLFIRTIDKYKAESEDNMTDIKNLIIETANRRDLTFAQNFNGRAYALMDINWIGYFDTLDDVIKFLGISVEADKTESEE